MLRKLLVILLFGAFATSELYSQNDSIAKSEELPKPADKKKQKDTAEVLPPVLGDIYKPTVGLGVGMLSYYGDLYTKHAQPFSTSRIGYELIVSQPLSKSFHLNFYGLYGKLGANERLGIRNENFQSEIRMGGLRVMYDFSHLFKTDKHNWRPWIETGVEGFEFLTKTDLRDNAGYKYYYWSDGTIKNMAETDPSAASAINLIRDYTYETDVRELNADGFGKYPERSWAVPIGGGVLLHLNDRATFKIGTTFHLTFTDYLDGISNSSVGDRAGTKAKDKFVMTSFSIHYDLVTKKKTDTLPDDYYDNVDMLAFDNDDEDGDGVNDFQDDCHKTPKVAKVDKKGCPVDDDKDLTPDYYDEELPTPSSMIANVVGIGITDDMAQDWYDVYYDSTGMFAKTIDLDSAAKQKAGIVDPNSMKKDYTVELARFKGGVPSDIMAYLLSIGDVRSTTVGDEIVIYTAGSYADIKMAIQRKDEFVAEGIKDAKVGYFKGGQYYEIKTEAELNKEIAESAANTSNATVTAGTVKGVIYRVQLGAYKQPLSASLFKHVGKIIELKTDDGYYKYVTESFNSFDRAMIAKADVILEGYSDAFVSAYKDGKRISLSEAGATFENKNDAKNEILDESKNNVNAFDKTLVTFRVQIGALKKANDSAFEERIKDVSNVEKIVTTTGLVRYTSGSYTNYNQAVQAKSGLAEKGFNDAFVIAMFKGEVISIQEALEILGTQK
ncbi:MAG: SPOR domain-containing protein [Bacteroidota bacterium]|nr:SPOR domain-containing protein [Bacteroidota bacterium]